MCENQSADQSKMCDASAGSSPSSSPSSDTSGSASSSSSSVSASSGASSSGDIDQRPRRKKDTTLTLAAGCIAGALECSATWPVEYIKTQQQSPRKIMVSGGMVSAPQPYKGIIEGLQYNVKTSGFYSLYTGLTPTLILSVPKAGCRFGANQYFRNLFRSPTDNKLTPTASFAAGVLAGISEAVLVVTPQVSNCL